MWIRKKTSFEKVEIYELTFKIQNQTSASYPLLLKWQRTKIRTVAVDDRFYWKITF